MQSQPAAEARVRVCDWKWRMLHVLKVYFAPLTGAVKGIRAEYRRLDEEAAQRKRRARQETAAPTRR